MKLKFGYNDGLPDEAPAAWGARLIVTQDGGVDFVWDRQDCVGEDEDRKAFLDLLNVRYDMDRLRTDLSTALKDQRVQTRSEAEVTLYSDDDLVVVGNSNASVGYFYVVAFARHRPTLKGSS